MCGIAGIFNTAGDEVSSRKIAAMVSMLHHRGPDGEGCYVKGPIGLGHARLSIIDIEGGAQPIHNEDKSIWVVFNGEIFNYIELRSELKKQGHTFYTNSDTEVIVHAYEQYGDDFPNYLNGQFAISIWDNKKKKLVLVRDRVGIHPLFYSQRKESTSFASEIKAITAIDREAPELNPTGLDQIMTFWSTVGKTTIFKNIYQVQPGEIITVEPGVTHCNFYWDWKFPVDHQYDIRSEQELAVELHDLLLDATRLRLRADVPVGAYLSGGLDSSVIAALMNEQNAKLRTFSIGFEDKNFDESHFQRSMAEHIAADHSHMQCTTNDIGAAFERAIWHTETPVLRTAPVPMMLLSKLVHEQNYKVVLTGEGSDEVLGGYDIFKEAKIRTFWSKNPDSYLRPLLLKKLYPYLDISNGQGQAYIEAFFGAGIREPNTPHFSHMLRWNTTATCKAFFSSTISQQLKHDAIENLVSILPTNAQDWHRFNRAQYIEAKSLMSGYLLSSQGDRMLMANSVEGRFPFLDHRVIEFANMLHPNLKMKVLKEKYLLKKAMLNYLPNDIIARYKQPYRAPDILAFFGNKSEEYTRDMLSDEKIKKYGYFEAQMVNLLIKKIVKGRAIGYKDNMAFVGILSTQIWHSQFIANHSGKMNYN